MISLSLQHPDEKFFIRVFNENFVANGIKKLVRNPINSKKITRLRLIGDLKNWRRKICKKSK